MKYFFLYYLLLGKVSLWKQKWLRLFCFWTFDVDVNVKQENFWTKLKRLLALECRYDFSSEKENRHEADTCFKFMTEILFFLDIFFLLRFFWSHRREQYKNIWDQTNVIYHCPEYKFLEECSPWSMEKAHKKRFIFDLRILKINESQVN